MTSETIHHKDRRDHRDLTEKSNQPLRIRTVQMKRRSPDRPLIAQNIDEKFLFQAGLWSGSWFRTGSLRQTIAGEDQADPQQQHAKREGAANGILSIHNQAPVDDIPI